MCNHNEEEQDLQLEMNNLKFLIFVSVCCNAPSLFVFFSRARSKKSGELWAAFNQFEFDICLFEFVDETPKLLNSNLPEFILNKVLMGTVFVFSNVNMLFG